MLPILHRNGYKISNPTILSRISDEELIDLFSNINKEVTTLDFEAIRQEKESIDKQISDIFRQLNELKEKTPEMESPLR